MNIGVAGVSKLLNQSRLGEKGRRQEAGGGFHTAGNASSGNGRGKFA